MAQAVRDGVLFVSHDATRSGAPIALLHFLRWFKKNGGRPFSILLLTDGEMTPAFAEIAETWSIDRSRWRPDGLRTGLLFWAGRSRWASCAEIADVQRFAARCSPGLVYVNSIASARAVDLLRPTMPILTHVHELEHLFRMKASPALSALLAQTQQFIACSNAVKENLIQEHEVAPGTVETVHESIPVDQVQPERTRRQVREELQVPDNAVLVIGGGTHNWRKGADLFVQLARVILQQRSDVYFVWIGGLAYEVAELEHDVRLLGLTANVRFTSSVSKPSDYIAASDIFALTSREDPYPLICLEAAALAKPIVCFARAGGMPEFVEEDCGFAVPYLDIIAMGDRLLLLHDSLERRVTMGAAARRKVTQRHDISRAAPRILEIIERTVAAGER